MTDQQQSLQDVVPDANRENDDDEVTNRMSQRIQAKFRAYKTRELLKWKMQYMTVRTKLVFSEYARHQADATHRNETESKLRSLVPELVYSRLTRSTKQQNAATMSENSKKWCNLCEVHAGSLAETSMVQNPFNDFGIEEDLQGAMIFIDLDGFVSLTEKILKSATLPQVSRTTNNKTTAESASSTESKLANGKGATASEMLMTCINAHLEQIIDVIDSFGGDVLKFAGDAVQVFFAVDTGHHEVTAHEQLSDVASKAVRCSLNVMKRLSLATIMGMNRNMTVKIGLGIGQMKLHVVGGPCSRFETFMSGEPVTQSSAYTGAATAGNELILDTNALKLCNIDVSSLDQLPNGLTKVVRNKLPDKKLQGALLNSIDELYIINERFEEELLPQPLFGGCHLHEKSTIIPTNVVALEKNISLARPATFRNMTENERNGKLAPLKKPRVKTSSQLDSAASKLVVGGLSAFIPISILSQILKGHINLISGIRNLTVMFMHFSNHESILSTRGGMQRVFTLVQSTLYTHCGSVRQIMIDDKGMVLIGFFGMNGFQHRIKALRASVYLVKQFSELEIPISIGLTTGQCYFGLIGSENRSEVTIAGSTVNKAARLMGAAKAALVSKTNATESDGTIHAEKSANTNVSTCNLYCDSSIRSAAGESSVLCEFHRVVVRLKGFKGLTETFDCVPRSRSHARKQLLQMAASSIIWSRSHTDKSIAGRRKSSTETANRIHSVSEAAFNESVTPLNLEPRFDSSLSNSPTIQSEFILGPTTPITIREHSPIRSRGRRSSHLWSDSNRGSVGGPVDSDQYWAAMIVIATASRYNQVLAFDCLYECISDRSVRYRLKSLLNEIVQHEILQLVEFPDKSVASYLVVGKVKLANTYNSLLKSQRDEIHLKFAQELVKRLNQVEQGDKTQLPLYVGKNGTTTSLLVSIANHFSVAPVQYRHQASDFLALASKRCYAENDLVQAEECSRGALLLMEEEERNIKVEKGLLEQYIVRHDWNILQSTSDPGEIQFWVHSVYEVTLSMLRNFGVNLFCSLEEKMSSNPFETISELNKESAGTRLGNVQQLHHSSDNNNNLGSLVLIVNYTHENGDDLEVAFVRENCNIRRLYQIKNVYPNLFFHVSSPINHEWVDLSRASIGPRNFHTATSGVRLQFESNVAATCCVLGLEILTKLCHEHDFELYIPALSTYLDHTSGMMDNTNSSFAIPRPSHSSPALPKNTAESLGGANPNETTGRTTFHRMNIKDLGARSSHLDHSERAQESPRTRAKNLKAALLRSRTKADVLRAFNKNSTPNVALQLVREAGDQAGEEASAQVNKAGGQAAVFDSVSKLPAMDDETSTQPNSKFDSNTYRVKCSEEKLKEHGDDDDIPNTAELNIESQPANETKDPSTKQPSTMCLLQ